MRTVISQTGGYSLSMYFAIIIIMAFICYFIAAGVFAGQDQIEIIESTLSKEKQGYETFDSREKDLLGQLSHYEQQVAEKKQAIEKLTERIRKDEVEIGGLEKELAGLESSLLDAESKASKRIVSLYKYAVGGYINTLASVMDIGQFRQRLNYLRAISEEDHNQLSAFAQQIGSHRASISNLTERITDKRSEESQEKARLLAMRRDLEERVVLLIQIHKEKEFYETAVRELELASQDLRQTFTEIEKNKGPDTTWSSGFENSKGLLPVPLQGKMIRGDRLLGSDKQHFNKGVFIEGIDKDVRAVFCGRVEFSGQIKGYGDILIINHGSRFFTISAQVSQRIKEEGDMVEAGDVIAIAGQSGNGKKARLYFEMRKAGVSLNPLEWLEKKSL
ncbi:hypothetical protein PITCH_A420021 [uncultured Desulfobacterium sp.]|uniref:M23ase beta-sheet core domain-containing protein n=1 Tax=uncultured Desulfobacterium sp. TaxID=201089 RepID=A0A445N0D3_9BACT|nr:hypothetical protein PITCH_A420021 [uncultured Desulfobacterium sp.]